MGTTVQKLVVGLGNPGERYANNRHNVGFALVDHMGESRSACFAPAFSGEFAEALLEGLAVGLLKPMTFMNRSGVAVRKAATSLALDSQNIIVIHDDVDLPFSRIRIKARGGDGGHRGVGSIIERMGTEDFPRLRVGIGRPLDGDVTAYVLGDFTQEEHAQLEVLLQRCEEAVLTMLRSGLQEAMNRFNGLLSGLQAEG